MVDWDSVLTSYLGGLTGGFAFVFASWCLSTGSTWTDKKFRKGKPQTEMHEYTRMMAGLRAGLGMRTPNAMFWASSSPITALVDKQLWLSWYISASDSLPITTGAEPSYGIDTTCTGKIRCSGDRSNKPFEIVTTNSSFGADLESLRTDNSTRNSLECESDAPALTRLVIW